MTRFSLAYHLTLIVGLTGVSQLAFSADKAACFDAKKELRPFLQFGETVKDTSRKLLFEDPRKVLKPGDVLIYLSDRTRAEHEPPPYMLMADGEKPSPQIVNEGDQIEARRRGGAAFYRAMEGITHAAIVGRSKNGKGLDALYHLDSPYLGKEVARDGELQGSRPYLIIRAKTPVGKSEDFEKKINRTVEAMADVGWEYDTFANTPFLDEKAVAKVRKAVEAGCLNKSDLPDLYCSGLTQLAIAVAGGKTAKPTTLGNLVDRAVRHTRASGSGEKLTEAELISRVTAETSALVDNFVPHQAEAVLLAEQEELKKSVEQKREKLKDKTLPEEQRKKLESDLKFDEEMLGRFPLMIASNRSAAYRVSILKSGLGAAVRAQITGKSNPLLGLAAAPLLGRQLVRPVDILKEARDPKGAYEIVGIYPGHLPPCSKENQIELGRNDFLPPIMPAPDAPKRMERAHE